MPAEAPILTIGMPVYNGEQFLESTLASILGQTFGDYELIISDNASTDQTEQICRDHAERDSRIRYIRQPRNAGAVRNWNLLPGEANGIFFKWASAHDYYDPPFLERCLDVLRKREDVVLAYTRTNLVRDDGSFIGHDPTDLAVMHRRPRDRFLRLMEHGGRNNSMSGVVRREPLLRTGLDRFYPHGDKVMLARLAVAGKFWLIEEPLFYRRMGPASSFTHYGDASELQAYLDPTRASSPRFDRWRQQLDYLWSSLTVDLPLAAKPLLFLRVARRMAWHRGELWQELVDGIRRFARS